MDRASVSRRRSLFVWLLVGIIGAGTLIVYLSFNLAAGRGEVLMPLDDVYIHFQYAHQITAGQPYVYNPGLPPSSGATSFLYPWLLAVGDWLGFDGLKLGLWALVIGTLALVGSGWLVCALALDFGAPFGLAVPLAVGFMLAGPVAWHFMSGMETGLVVLFTLWTLYTLLNQNLRAFVAAATLLALLRPEASLLAAMAAVAMWLSMRSIPAARRLWLLLPAAAVGVQPLVNALVTGSAVASGNSAKSVFGMVPFDWGTVISRVVDNLARMWLEFATGISPREGVYLPPLLLALAGIALLGMGRKRRVVALLVVGWLLAGTLAVATLDTAFWHFKRYQMPFLVLFYPLAALPFGWLWRAGASRPAVRIAPVTVLTVILLISFATGAQFLSHYRLNLGYVYQQPYQMARWLAANTPPGAVVAVHDTGLMRYLGGRTTIDMVGLTTPGAADYWRSGPGSTAEYLNLTRPHYIASYGRGHGLGLGMLAETSIYGSPLALFVVDELDSHYNVALAGPEQAIYQPNWNSAVFEAGVPLQPRPFTSSHEPGWLRGLNVADLSAEAAADYHWSNPVRVAGFPTEVREMDYVACLRASCRIVDGGRLIYGEERFRLALGAVEGDMLLVTRVHPAYPKVIDIYANGRLIDTQWVPSIPGRWLEIVTLIPRDVAASSPAAGLDVRIVPRLSGLVELPYMPYYHWLMPAPEAESKPGSELTRFQDGAIILASTAWRQDSGARQLAISFEWYSDGDAQGDYKLFIHVLDSGDQIVAQTDTYPGGGTLPPGNWLPGVLRDTIVVDLGEVPPGRYRVAMGLYDSSTFERLTPAGGDVQKRFFMGEVVVAP